MCTRVPEPVTTRRCPSHLFELTDITLLHVSCIDAKAVEHEAALATVPTCASVPKDAPRQIAVIGGGLAGCTAALSAYSVISQLPDKPQVEIVLVERMPKLGGNSAKVRPRC